MEDLEELLKTVEVYFSIYFSLFLDIQFISDKQLIKDLLFSKKLPYSPSPSILYCKPYCLLKAKSFRLLVLYFYNKYFYFNFC